MQRTVYSTKFTYAKTTLNNDGTITAEIATHTVHETDEKRAYRKACKEIGAFTPLKTERVSALYVLDDEIFFKYATIKEGSENGEAEDTENN